MTGSCFSVISIPGLVQTLKYEIMQLVDMALDIDNSSLRLLTLCSEHSLVIANTLFQLKNNYKTSWRHPKSKHWHLLDYIIVRQRDQRDERVTRAMRGAEYWTDHQFIRSKMRLEIRP